MTKPVLDRSVTFNSCYPPGEERGAFYSQNGHYFDREGKWLFSSAGVSETAASAAASSDPEGEETPKAPDAVLTEDVNLVAWAKGEIKYPFHKVKAHMAKEGYDLDQLANKQTMLAALQKAGVVTLED